MKIPQKVLDELPDVIIRGYFDTEWHVDFWCDPANLEVVSEVIKTHDTPEAAVERLKSIGLSAAFQKVEPAEMELARRQKEAGILRGDNTISTWDFVKTMDIVEQMRKEGWKI